MPTVEYKCRRCGHAFQRVVLRGDEDRPLPCPACGNTGMRPEKGPESLFQGIANFSRLAKDTN